MMKKLVLQPNRVSFVFVALLTTMSFSACSSLGISDGSLDYRKKQILPPLDMAGESGKAIKPALNLPAYKAGASTQYTNDRGNRFVMPSPTTAITNTSNIGNSRVSSARNVKTQVINTTAQQALPGRVVLNRPTVNNQVNNFQNRALTENERGVPILQVQVSEAALVNKAMSTLSAANIKVTKPLSGGYLILSSALFEGERLLRFNNQNSVTTVLVTNPNNTLADLGEARYILNKIYEGL